MEQSYPYQADRPLPDNYDALEAYKVFRRARNWLFVVILLCLILVQGAFWIVDQGGLERVVKNKLISYNPIQSETVETREILADLVEVILNLCNPILVFTLALYFLVQWVSINVAMVGRLGGLASSSKAFLLSLVMVVLLLPWESWYGGWNSGMLFSYADLVKNHLPLNAESTAGGSGMIEYYFRFVGLWLIMLALAILAQVFSGKAWKQMCHRSRGQSHYPPAIASPIAAAAPTPGTIPLEQTHEGRDLS